MSPPSYPWICQNCQQRNGAGTESCAACGFPACATGHELAAFRNGIVPERPVKTHPPRAAPPKNPFLPLAKLFWWAGGLFGLLLGGCMLLLSGEIYLLLLFL
jgi:hypothetical protein